MKRKGRCVPLVVAVVFACSGCDSASDERPVVVAGRSPEPGHPPILFHSDPSGADDLYLMEPNGNRVRQLTFGAEANAFGLWSPDGTRIAFEGRTGGNHIYVIGVAGGDPVQITSEPGEEFEPSWSPDGTEIAFTSVDDDGATIGIARADGSGEVDLDRRAVPGGGPEWSPDGDQIAFISEERGDLDIYMIGRDAGNSTRLTDGPRDDFGPAWSPDGRSIAFFSDRDGDSELFVMNSDGSGELQITHNRIHDEFATWSPDGSRIAFVSYKRGADPLTLGDGNAEVFVATPDGSDVANVTRRPTWEGDPAWSSDGSQLLFTRRDGLAQIFVTSPRGGAVRLRAVVEPSNDCCSSWAPSR